MRCAGGAITRLRTHFATAGATSFGAGTADAPLHVLGGNVPGSRADYQAWYRDAQSFCSPSTFNLTNAVEIVWEP